VIWLFARPRIPSVPKCLRAICHSSREETKPLAHPNGPINANN
jgi:hypothetical protein